MYNSEEKPGGKLIPLPEVCLVLTLHCQSPGQDLAKLGYLWSEVFKIPQKLFARMETSEELSRFSGKDLPRWSFPYTRYFDISLEDSSLLLIGLGCCLV